MQCVNVLKEFYGEPQQSIFSGETNISYPVIDKIQLNEELITSFFLDFQAEVKRERGLLNSKIRKLIQIKKLKPENVDQFKEENPISAESVFKSLMKERAQYPDILILFKLSLLITPSTANVERGFSVLTLLATKQRNSLSPSTLDKLMRITLIGPPKLEDSTYETLVDRFQDSKDRPIEL